MAKAPAKGKKTFKKKERKNIPVGIVHVSASFNNTLISITDTQGNLVAQSSSGARGFRGSRKGTPFAAQQAAGEAARKALEAGMRDYFLTPYEPTTDQSCRHQRQRKIYPG